MTQQDPPKPTWVRGVAASVPPPRGHVLAVLGWLASQPDRRFEPDEVVARNHGHLIPPWHGRAGARVDGVATVEVLFHSEPPAVDHWAAMLGFDPPVHRGNDALRQVVVETSGIYLGWRIELRHIHTVEITIASPPDGGAPGLHRQWPPAPGRIGPGEPALEETR